MTKLYLKHQGSLGIALLTSKLCILMECIVLMMCIYNSVGDGVTVMLEWVRDGRVIDSGSGTQLLLHISQVEEVHEGEYSCRAILTPQSVSDPVTTVGPVSGGTLTVLSKYDHEYISVTRL